MMNVTQSQQSVSRRPLRIGVIGIGQRSVIARHVEGGPTEAILVAALDITPEGRDRAGEFLGKKVSVYSTLDSFIAEADVDAALVTTPDWTHAQIAIEL